MSDIPKKLEHFKTAFASVGWFIPPYVSMGFLSAVAGEINRRSGEFSQQDLETALAPIYDTIGLAALIKERYPSVPVLGDYQKTIQEAVEAHFLGLHHVAVGGLIPVIEGAGRRLALLRGLKSKSVKQVFIDLAEDCRIEVIERKMGEVGEVIWMLESFSAFATDFLYTNSGAYSLIDGTNRHGIAHGSYSDADYGRPINFYKIITAVNFLTFISSFRAGGSWFWPSSTNTSNELAKYFDSLRGLRQLRPS